MKLNAINLRTARLPEMVSFYRDLLGLPCQERVPGRWEIQVGDLCLALVQGENVPPPDPENCLLEFAVEDAQASTAASPAWAFPPRASPPTCPGATAISPSKTRTATASTLSRSSDTKKREEAPPLFFYFPPPLFRFSMIYLFFASRTFSREARQPRQ